MKTLFSIFVPVIFIGFLLKPVIPVNQGKQKSDPIYTAEVRKVIDGKCYGCHSDQGKSFFAKNALLWDSLPNLPKSSLIATLDDISTVIEKNKMPPAKAVKKNPEMKLSPEESMLLQSWAESTADSLMN